MLAENKSWSKGIFRAALGPDNCWSSSFCYRKVVRSPRNYSGGDRQKKFDLSAGCSLCSSFQILPLGRGTGLMERVRSSPTASLLVQDGKQLLQAQAVCTAPPVQEQWQGWPSKTRSSCELAPLTFHWWASALHGMVLQDVLVKIPCAHGTKHL